MKIRLADYVANFLVEKKVTDVFSVVGGGAMHLNDAIGHNKGLKVTYNHHEQACAIAAEAYARLENRIAAVGCLAVIFSVVCLIINFHSENEKSHYGTVHRSKAAEQKKEGITQYFISLRGLDENSEYSYYSEEELAEAGQDFCDDYSVCFPQGIEDTGKGQTVVKAIRKDIERWKKREPSFQGCEVIKEKHTLHETMKHHMYLKNA